jgi:hypothetical protein
MWKCRGEQRRPRRFDRLGFATVALALVLVAGGCAEKIAGPGQSARVKVSVDLKAGPTASFELTVTGPDMDPVTGAMTPGDDSVVAALSVPLGPDRVFRVEALDEFGAVLYRGSQTVDVIPLLPLELTIPLEPVATMIYLNPHFARIALGSPFTITVNANALQDMTAATFSFYLYEPNKGDKLAQVALIDSLTLAPEQAARGSWLSYEQGTESAWFSISGEMPIVDEQGDAALVIIHCRTQDTWLPLTAAPDSLEPVIYLESLSGFAGSIEPVHVDTARYRLRRDHAPESYLGGPYDDAGIALVDLGGGNLVVAGSTTGYVEMAPTLYLARLDAKRVPLWESELTWPNYESTTAVAAAAGGGFWATGNGMQSGSSVVRVDAAGAEVWRPASYSEWRPALLAVAGRPLGGCVVAGSWQNDGLHYFLAAYDRDGNASVYAPTDFSAAKEFQAVVTVDDSTFVAAGYRRPFSTTGNAVLAKFTLGTGFTEQWTQPIGGLGDETARDLMVLADGFLLVGAVSDARGGVSDLLAVRTDRNGVVRWSRQFGQPGRSEFGYAVCAAPGGGFVAVGTSADFGGNRDVYAVKFDGQGNLVWENVLGSPGDDTARDVLPVSGGYLVTGASAPGPNGRTDILLLQLDSGGSKRSD